MSMSTLVATTTILTDMKHVACSAEGGILTLSDNDDEVEVEKPKGPMDGATFEHIITTVGSITP